MKIVVFGPLGRAGALRDGSIVDLSYAYAKYLRERTNEPSSLEMGLAIQRVALNVVEGSMIGIEGSLVAPPTRSPEAVARPRFPVG